MIHPSQIRDFPPDQVCVLISGTQGEPMSALSRAAVENHKHARIEPGDTVVLSSRIIPGNEKAIYRMIDHLFRREANVIYEDGSSPPVHVSGHASQEELKLIMNLVKPRYLVPIHGEYRQLRLHADLARSLHGATPEEKADYGVIKEKIRADLKRFIGKTTSRRPLIMPVILEI